MMAVAAAMPNIALGLLIRPGNANEKLDRRDQVHQTMKEDADP
jgi:hypothetical protein